MKVLASALSYLPSDPHLAVQPAFEHRNPQTHQASTKGRIAAFSTKSIQVPHVVELF